MTVLIWTGTFSVTKNLSVIHLIGYTDLTVHLIGYTDLTVHLIGYTNLLVEPVIMLFRK